MVSSKRPVLINPVVSVLDCGNRATVVLAGEIDVANSGSLRACLREILLDDFTDITVDMSDVTFMDSTGLGALVGAARAVKGKGRVTVWHPPGSVRRFFLYTGADRVIQVEPPQGEAAKPACD